MQNQFRNDGEMPPHIAAQFPVGDTQEVDGAKSKSKRSAADHSHKRLTPHRRANRRTDLTLLIWMWRMLPIIILLFGDLSDGLTVCLIISVILGAALAKLESELSQGEGDRYESHP